jgi:hypothetical protein
MYHIHLSGFQPFVLWITATTFSPIFRPRLSRLISAGVVCGASVAPARRAGGVAVMVARGIFSDFNAFNSRAKTEERDCSTLFTSPRSAWGRYAAQSRCLQAGAGQAGAGGRSKHPAFAMKNAKSFAFAFQQNEVQRLRFRHPAPSCSSSPAVTLFAVKSAKRARASPPLPQERAQECTDASEERQSTLPDYRQGEFQWERPRLRERGRPLYTAPARASARLRRALASGFVMLLAKKKASITPKPCHNQLSDLPTLSRCLQGEMGKHRANVMKSAR